VLDLDAAQEASAGLDGEPAQRSGLTPAKGKADAQAQRGEKRRRQPYSAPGDRKAAGAQGKERDREGRARRMEAMRRGEDWALPRKDQGPLKALARDVVDSRRGISEYYLYAIVVLIVLLFVPALRGKAIVDYVILVILAVIVIEGWWVSRKVKRLAHERYPGQNTRGLAMYTAMRGTQIRKMRVPVPRVKPGDKIPGDRS